MSSTVQQFDRQMRISLPLTKMMRKRSMSNELCHIEQQQSLIKFHLVEFFLELNVVLMSKP